MMMASQQKLKLDDNPSLLQSSSGCGDDLKGLSSSSSSLSPHSDNLVQKYCSNLSSTRKHGTNGGLKAIELRAKVIEDWKNRESVPFRVSTIARKYGLSVCKVYGIIKRYKETKSIKDRPRCGRKPTACTPENINRIKEILELNPSLSSRQIGKQLSMNDGTVRRLIKRIKKRQSVTEFEDVGVGSESGRSLAVPGQGLLGATSTSPKTQMEEEDDCDWNWGEDFDSHEDGRNRERNDSSAGATFAHCFLCDAQDANLLELRSTSTTTPSPVPVEVEKSMWVITFLKDILNMRNGDLISLFGVTEGKHPNEWMVSVCTDPECRSSVEKAFDLWREMKRLEVELRKRRKLILDRVRSCWKGKGDINIGDDQALVNERVQQVLRRGERRERVETEEVTNDRIFNVKVEPVPHEEDFSDFDDFHGSEDHEYLGENFGVKAEANDNDDDNVDDLRRRSGRTRRKATKFTIEPRPSSSSLKKGVRRGAKALGKGSGRKKKAQVKVAKSDGKSNSMKSAKANTRPIPSERKANVSRPQDAEVPLYSCQSCPSLDKMDMDKFIAHIAFHSSHPNKCTQCPTYFLFSTSDVQVQKHWEELHPESISTSPKVIQVSPLDAAGKIWPCSRSKCKEKFGSPEERDGHQLAGHGIQCSMEAILKKCPICPSQFPNLTELRLHKSMEHPEDALLSCCYCDSQFEIRSKNNFRFLNLDQLKEHISVEHPERAYKNEKGEQKTSSVVRFLQTCPICGLVFHCTNYSKLDKHLVEDHGRNLYETYSCPECPKQMRHTDAWGHIREWHWPEAPRKYICQFCGKGFRRDSNRTDHEQIHKNKETRPFQCELCGSSFAVRTYLLIHRRVTHQHRPSPSALRKKRAQSGIQVFADSENGMESKPELLQDHQMQS